MTITAQMVKELRDRTAAGMMDCKKALQETDGDLEKAIDVLRKKGLSQAAKRAGRETAEGVVSSYLHAGGKIGVLVELNCETDFVARTDEFLKLCRDVAMHVAAADPKFISREEVTGGHLDREREIFRDQAIAAGKPENIVDRIVEGKIGKYYSECCLLEQPFVKDPDRTVGDLVTESIATIGENIQVRRFARYVLGAEATVAST